MTKKFKRILKQDEIYEKGDTIVDGDDGWTITSISRVEELAGKVYVTFHAKKMTGENRDRLFGFIRALEVDGE
jgi:hypothetical protein